MVQNSGFGNIPSRRPVSRSQHKGSKLPERRWNASPTAMRAQARADASARAEVSNAEAAVAVDRLLASGDLDRVSDQDLAAARANIQNDPLTRVELGTDGWNRSA